MLIIVVEIMIDNGRSSPHSIGLMLPNSKIFMIYIISYSNRTISVVAIVV